MTEVVRFDLVEGSTVLVEVDERSLGIERVSRGRDGVVEAGRRLTEALGSVGRGSGVDGSAADAVSGPHRAGVRGEVGR
jgi:hypothetical protein